MNVYVIYKFNDSEKVNSLLNEYKKKDSTHALNFFMFNKDHSKSFWHRKAKEKMIKSNIVVYFYSDEQSRKTKNVKWELNLANSLKKRIYICDIGSQLNSSTMNKFAKDIFGTDYSEELLNIAKYKIFHENDFYGILESEAKWNIEDDVISKDFDKTKLSEKEYYELLLNEYKIMVDTSEKLMERRHNTSNLYMTLCAALVAAVGASFAFDNWWAVGYISLGVGIVFIFLANNWRACLKAYEMNNQGKFAVINAIEKILPVNLFDSEYRYNTKNGIKSYSSREKILPMIFMGIGILLIIFAIVMVILLSLSILK